jgi:hypothetical protein
MAKTGKKTPPFVMMDLESMVPNDHSLRKLGAPEFFKSTNDGGNWSSFATGLIPGVDTVFFPRQLTH